ncbi:DUF4136 domain-containing protein [Hahella ganghwensis]|uniref:DUF4136 domain-containing protein n=1 Tax=Hahella ganghwensis TaxID=286420 RepID=UPI00035DF7A8|nr:DUF4136 domain-containing protein [Hahella ganghwensis]
MLNQLKQSALKVICFGLICYGLVACSGVQVRQDYAPGYDFSTVKTYQWNDSAVAGLTPQPVPLQTQRIKAAVTGEMAARGITESPDPDILLSSRYRIEQRTEYRSYPSLGFWHRDPFDHEIVAHDYEVGILSVEMVEPASNRVIWQSEAVERVDSYMSPEEKDQMVKLSVQAIFERFPPGQDKQ